MKGKHGAAAATRRDWSAIERERDEALVRAARAERDLAKRADQFEAAAAAAARELAVMRKAASEGIAPIVETLEERLTAANQRCDDAVHRLRKWNEFRERFADIMAKTIVRNFGVLYNEARSMVTEVWLLCPGIEEVEELAQWLSEEARAEVIGSAAASVVRRSDDGRITKRQANIIMAARAGMPTIKAGDVDSEWGQMWTSEEDRWNGDRSDLGPLTRDAAAAAAGDQPKPS